jgi:hypothetical protein
VDPVRVKINEWLQQPVKSILSGLLVVMLFPTSVKGEKVNVGDLRRQGIEVDDDNEPAPENAEPTMMNPGNGRLEKPTMCPRQMATINNAKGKFNSHRWEVLAEMNEFDRFRMCFSEKIIINVITPQTNQNLGTPINLQEFYV